MNSDFVVKLDSEPLLLLKAGFLDYLASELSAVFEICNLKALSKATSSEQSAF